MTIKNTNHAYGWMTIVIHWLMALVVVSLFGVGLWMTDLDYSNPWYQTAPHWHKSIGVLVVALLVFRFVWRMANPKPHPIEGHKVWEMRLASLTHYGFYLLILLMFPTGYLITTAKGQGLEVFDWFTIPSVVQGVDNLEDYAGEVHEWLGFIIVGLAAVHALGALKHHFIDKDNTLKRMLKSG